MNIELLFWLIIAHFFGDYALQSDWIATNKCKSWYVLTAHTAIWIGCISIVLKYFGVLDTTAVSILSAHWVIDYEKCKGRTNLWQDQTLHFIQLITVWCLP